MTPPMAGLAPLRIRADFLGEPLALLVEAVTRFLFRMMSALFGPADTDGYGVSDWALFIALLAALAVGIAWLVTTVMRVPREKGRKGRR